MLLAEHDSLLHHYVPHCQSLLEHLSETQAVIGGFSALSFLLRDPSIRPHSLEIFVPASKSEQLEQLLDEDEELLLGVPTTSPHPCSNSPVTLARITRVTTFDTFNDRSITIYTSTSETALDPVAASPATALNSWLSPYAFGCGYPILTLNRRSIVRLPVDFIFELLLLYTQLDHNGFDISAEPHLWNDWGRRVDPAASETQQPCLRAWNICPDQGRFFGDAGSLLTVFDLVGHEHDHFRLQQQPPYGLGICWRFLSDRRPCTSLCREADPLLPPGVHVMPAVLVDQTCMLRAMI
ncbi:hypothetical protein C2E23DRAFT_871321 [Lenzites betulinus]|nr:hypothetical protein C2E23DRAFT_871321 [Lenzites betulinus]